jgi:hypothetical protein
MHNMALGNHVYAVVSPLIKYLIGCSVSHQNMTFGVPVLSHGYVHIVCCLGYFFASFNYIFVQINLQNIRL